MSFSKDVKEELIERSATARHCLLAELSALFEYNGFYKETQNKTNILGIQSENKLIAIKSFTLLKKTFNIYTSISIIKHHLKSKSLIYQIIIENPKEVLKVLTALKLDTSLGETSDLLGNRNAILLKNSCCKRAYLRSAYLSAGSMSDPSKSYHLEIIGRNQEQADKMITLLKSFEMEAKSLVRKNNYVVYIKDGEMIAQLLNILGAHMALMELENTRIVKEVRNSINRQVNCETANISKTVNAAARQVEDILLIKEKMGFENLQENLREMAQVRLEYPDVSLKELTQYLDPPVGKSGVNHRLRKLSELAERLKMN